MTYIEIIKVRNVELRIRKVNDTPLGHVMEVWKDNLLMSRSIRVTEQMAREKAMKVERQLRAA